MIYSRKKQIRTSTKREKEKDIYLGIEMERQVNFFFYLYTRNFNGKKNSSLIMHESFFISNVYFDLELNVK
jgi:hypothetical protein